MAKNKTKKNSLQHQRQATLERINRQNKEYMKGLEGFLDQLNLKQHFNLLSTKCIKDLETYRISSLRMIPSEQKDNSAAKEEWLMKFFKAIIERNGHVSYNNGCTISYKEYFIYMVSLSIAINKRLNEKNDERLRNAFGELLAFVEEKHTDIVNDMHNKFKALSVCLSDPIDGYFQFSDFDFINKNNENRKATDSLFTSIYMKYKRTAPPCRHIVIEGKKREVIEMAHISWLGELTWCTLAPSLLKKNGEAPIPIFIQKHAIHRIWERLDILFNEMHYFVAAQSIIDAKKIKQVGPNRYMIPTHFNNQKLGYMVANYVDNILVVTTFLFITQEGTPEGILLSKLTGFKKLDKSFLCIDKLSTFIKSDIASKPELVKILQDANLGHLVDLHVEIGYACKKQFNNTNDPSFILEYIKKKKEEEQLSLTEQQELEEVAEMELTPIPSLLEEQPMLLPVVDQQAHVIEQQHG